MAKKDYIPVKQSGKDTFLESWEAKIDEVLSDLSLPATHADNVKAKVTAQRTAFTDWKNAKALAKSKSADYRKKNKEMEKALRTYHKNLKSMAAYKSPVGNKIGIEGPEEIFDRATAQPKCSGTCTGNMAAIKFSNPRQVDMVEITSRRGAETSFSFLGNATSSPYFDARPNLDAHAETRDYIIWYIIDGKRIGKESQKFSVTLP
jgi:hypothetical protein